MALSQYALCSVEYAKSVLGWSDITTSRQMLYLYSTSTSAASAAVIIKDGTLTINNDLTTATFALSNASYDTIGELATAINATSNWFAAPIGPDSASSSDLFDIPTTSCLGASNAVTLNGTDNYSVERLIESATRAIERFCGDRKFVSRTHVEFCTPGGRETILRNLPVTDVARVCVGRRPAIRVGSTLASHTSAVVAVLDSSAVDTDAPSAAAGTLRLKLGSTTTSLSLSTYTTLTTLVAAINATSGWTASVVYDGTDGGSHPSTDLIPCGARSCRYPATVDLEMAADPIDAFDFDARTGVLYLGESAADYEDYGPQTSYASASPNSMLVEYVAGYSTVPADLQQACAEVMKFAMDKAKVSGALASEKIGNYSYELAGAMTNEIAKMSFPTSTQALLAPYRLMVAA